MATVLESCLVQWLLNFQLVDLCGNGAVKLTGVLLESDQGNQSRIWLHSMMTAVVKEECVLMEQEVFPLHQQLNTKSVPSSLSWSHDQDTFLRALVLLAGSPGLARSSSGPQASAVPCLRDVQSDPAAAVWGHVEVLEGLLCTGRLPHGRGGLNAQRLRSVSVAQLPEPEPELVPPRPPGTDHGLPQEHYWWW